MNALLVILGAAVGAPARFATDLYIRKYSNKPYGIFTVNIIGSFILGLTLGQPTSTHYLIGVGFAGAFTTWSTFILDLYLAFELKKYRDATLNLIFSIALGLLAAWLGSKL